MIKNRNCKLNRSLDFETETNKNLFIFNKLSIKAISYTNIIKSYYVNERRLITVRHKILFIRTFLTEMQYNQSCLSELHFSLLLPVISRLAARLVSSQRIGVARILILLSNRPLNLSTVAREREELRERERQRHGELKPGLHQSQQIILKAYYTKYQGLAFLRIAYAFKYARHCT